MYRIQPRTVIFILKGSIQYYYSFLLQSLQSSFLKNDYEVCLKHETYLFSDLYDDHQTNYYSVENWHLLIRYTAFAAQIIVLG